MFTKMQEKRSGFIGLLPALLCLALLLSVSGCGQQAGPAETDTSTEDIGTEAATTPETETTGEDANKEDTSAEDADTGNASIEDDGSELHSFLIPKSLMGGKTAEALKDELTDPEFTFLLESGEEVEVTDMISEIYLNDDGTLTYVLTTEQLVQYKQFLYDVATLNRLTSGSLSEGTATTSIKSTEFTSDDLTDIIVYVDEDTYDNYGYDGIWANAYTTTYMGLYQVMSGVGPYEWRVHVTVKDYETGEIITEDYYPTDR